MEQVKNWQAGNYNTTIGVANSSPTVRARQLDSLLAVDKARPGIIPDAVLIEATDLPEKEKILQEITAARQQGAAGIPTPGVQATYPSRSPG